MVSLCTVVVKTSMKYFGNFLETATTNLKLVDEIIVCNMDGGNPSEEVFNGIKVITFPGNKEVIDNGQWPGHWKPSLEHAVGLRQAINRSKNDYVLASDNDLFFYSPVDQIYYDLSVANDLSFVGVAENQLMQAMRCFPTVINMLIRKKDLPSTEDLEEFTGSFQESAGAPAFIAGEYLTPVKICSEEYPQPEGRYDTGCFLCLWAKRRNLNWLSFLPHDQHFYPTKYPRSNKPVKVKQNCKLLWHRTAANYRTEWEGAYLEAWEKRFD